MPKSSLRCDGCGRSLLPWMLRPIRCVCGTVFDDGDKPAPPPPKPIIVHSNGNAGRGGLAQSNALWRDLHGYGIVNVTVWDTSEARAWFRSWLRRVPNYCGSCHETFAAYCRLNPPDFSSGEMFFRWSVAAHNHVSTEHVSPPKPTMSVEEARRIYWPPHASSNLHHIISWDQFTRDIATLSQIILDRHPDVSGIAGVPRSGMRVAADLSIRFGVPLYEASKQSGLRYIGGGSRIESTLIHGRRCDHTGPVVLVDDSICSGLALGEVCQHAEIARLPRYAVYAASPGKDRVDGYAVNHELPHWFDWNLLNNGQVMRISRVGIDFDGVLCGDCLPEDDDDGLRYEAWLESVRPIRTPRDFTVPFIVTARREVYRDITEAWLARYRIQYGKLAMFPGTFAERSQTDLGQWKAEQCDRLGVGLFVESDYQQAKRIAELRPTTVISIEPRPLIWPDAPPSERPGSQTHAAERRATL